MPIYYARVVKKRKVGGQMRRYGTYEKITADSALAAACIFEKNKYRR